MSADLGSAFGLVHRPSRTTRPCPPAVEEPLVAPPTASEASGGSTRVQALLPVIGALSAGVMIVVFRGANPAFLVVGALLMVAAVAAALAMALGQHVGNARKRRGNRENYLDYLERLRLDLRERAWALRSDAAALDPPPRDLLDVARDPARIWERRPLDDDFLAVRVGTGQRPLARLRLPQTDPLTPFEPTLLAEARAVIGQYADVAGLPARVGLRDAGHVALIGPRAELMAMVRSLIGQLVSWHAPEEMELAVAFPRAAAADWAGIEHVPHLVDEGAVDRSVRPRRLFERTDALTAYLEPELRRRVDHAETARRGGPRVGGPIPHLVVLLDEHGELAADIRLPGSQQSLDRHAVTVIHLLADRLHEPTHVGVRLTVGSGRVIVEDHRSDDGEPVQDAVLPDATSPAAFEALARHLAGRRLSTRADAAAEGAEPAGVTELLGIDDEGPDGARWPARSARDFLRVPIGVDDGGAPVLLDLKESAHLGMGPHGLCVGATGSGKSELLRTLVLSLALSHPPDDVAMILVDYKGGAAFAPFSRLPHVAGVIDNLADDAQLIERARSSIAGEVVRRQQLLKAAGAMPSIGHYRRARTERPDLPPMPHLLVIIDEFGELLNADPDFVELLIQIGRIGRSIGVHLLLSSQRIEMGRLKGLDTYLSYRIGLRTFSETESAMILDTKDAFHLPPIPGFGYLKVDTTTYRRFRAAYVSASADPEPVPDPGADLVRSPDEGTLVAHGAPAYYEPLDLAAETASESSPERPGTGRTLLSSCLDRLEDSADDVAPIWLPPLPTAIALGEVLDRAEGGLDRLAVPIGLLDHPAKQTQSPWLLDLARAGGHVAVIGAPQSGRTTLLKTIAVAGALTHTPRQLSFYGMDLTGGGLKQVAGFPHVGGVASRTQPERLRRLMDELEGMIAVREQVFHDLDIDSLRQLRHRHEAGDVPELVAADVVLLVDGFAVLRTEFPDMEEAVIRLMQRGGSFGIHVVLGLSRWGDIRMAQQSLVGTRVEFHINDPIDSVVDRKLAALVPATQPGRALSEHVPQAGSSSGLVGQVALPVEALEQRWSGDERGRDGRVEVLGSEIQELAQRVAQVWTGPVAEPIRQLPVDLHPDQLAADVAPPGVPLGLRQDTMSTATLELGGPDQHLVVLGDDGSGKTTTLRGIVRGLTTRLSSDDVVFAVVDLRNHLASAVPREYLGGHATNAGAARGLLASVASELTGRLDRPADPDRPAPRIVVLIDDYDIVASGGTDPLAPLMALLPSARDLGLHVIVSRPVAGAARAMYDRALQTLRDTGGSLFIMSGDPAEGPIIPKTYAELLPPGRGRFIRRGEQPRLVQVANFQPVTSAAD